MQMPRYKTCNAIFRIILMYPISPKLVTYSLCECIIILCIVLLLVRDLYVCLWNTGSLFGIPGIPKVYQYMVYQHIFSRHTSVPGLGCSLLCSAVCTACKLQPHVCSAGCSHPQNWLHCSNPYSDITPIVNNPILTRLFCSNILLLNGRIVTD